ncbi:MAG: two-component regulator propeller domain-containing protein [Chitinophagaceae bacterium]
MRNLFSLLLLLIFFSLQLLQAQPGGQYYFTHYTITNGLLSNEVYSVAQDEDGYIWTGTNDGLQRFDGTRFKTFRHHDADTTSLPSNQVWQLMPDKKKRLWILTAEGDVGIFNIKNFTFQRFPLRMKSPESIKAGVKRLIKDEYGNIFLLLMGNEVLTLDEKAGEFSYRKTFFSPPPGKHIMDIVQQPGTRKYWLSLAGEEFAVYNVSTGNLSYAGHNTENEPAIERVKGAGSSYNLFIDTKNRLWFQTWGPGVPYIHCYDLGKNEMLLEKYSFISDLKSYYETDSFFEQENGDIWVCGLGVFAQYIEAEKRFRLVYNGYLNERSISYEKVSTLVEDREKNLWVATRNNGLYRFNPSEQYFTNISHTNRNSGIRGRGSIMSMMNTKWGTLLVGSWGDGLYHYDKDFNVIPTNIKGIDNKLGPSAWSMYASRDSNTIWVAAQPGIHAINQATRSATFYNPPVLENKTVRQLVEDKLGNLWLGVQGYGVFKWNAAEGKNNFNAGMKRFSKIPSQQVNKITVDSKGYIWVGMATEGLFVIDPATDSIVLHFHPSATQKELKISETGISSVMEYDDSTMVITTSRLIILYNRILKRSMILGTPETISGFIVSVERDKAGYLWVATTNGIYRVSTHKRIFIRFYRDDGIDNDHFILAASRALPDGRLSFGSSDQFIIFDPLKITINNTYVEVKLTGFNLMNRELSVDSLLQLKQVELSANNNSVVFEFAPLSYSSAYVIKYKLEGLDKDWRVADKNNQAIYSYLPTGKYVFMMKTTDSEGNADINITRLAIKVNPPFWNTWWFYSILAILTAGLLFWFDQERMKRKEAIQKMRSNIADNLHGEVSTALNNINILSEMARLKADKDPEKSKEYIEQIHTKSHNMIIAMDDMLWSINPDNDSMSKTSERMREYIDALKNRYGVNIDINVDKKVESMALNMKLRHEASLVFKEGIKNLVTVGAGDLHVYISLEKGKLLFTTQFNSENINMQQLNNLLHRQDLERRLKAMQGNIDVQLHKTSSVITLEVPVS